jgi:hypothetical protein
MKATETAIYLFNRALKKLILLDVSPTKENAKQIVLMEIESIKEALYNVGLIDGTPLSNLKQTITFYQEIKTTIEKL